MTFKLVGFIAELPGTDHHIAQADPVVEIGNRVFAAPKTNWLSDDLVELTVGDDEFVHFLRERDQHEIDEGDSVWIAGRTFVSGVDRVHYLRAKALEIRRWKLLAGGFRWTTGDHRSFTDFVVSLNNELELALHNFLFDQLEKSHGDCADVHELYAALPLEPTRERLINSGLYFDEIRDRYSLAFVSAEAVAEGFFNDDAAFEAAVRKLKKSLRETRLSEINNSTPADVADSVWLREFKLALARQFARADNAHLEAARDPKLTELLSWDSRA